MEKVKKVMAKFIIISISLPIILNVAFLFFEIPSARGLGNSEWLSFYASFYGGIFGGIATLCALYFTMKYYNQHDAEQKRLECYPTLYLYFPEESESILMIENIGVNPCIDIMINENLCIGTLRAGESIMIEGVSTLGNYFIRGREIVINLKDVRQNEYRRIYKQELKARNIVKGSRIYSYDLYTLYEEEMVNGEKWSSII